MKPLPQPNKMAGWPCARRRAYILCDAYTYIPPAIKMAEGLPVDRYSPNTLEKIVDGVLELERGQESLLELEEEVLGVAVKEHVPQNDGEVHLAQGEEEAFGCVEGVSYCAKDILYKISCFVHHCFEEIPFP